MSAAERLATSDALAVCAAVVSAVAAWLIHHRFYGDVDTLAWQGDHPDWAGGSIVIALVAAPCALAIARYRFPKRLAALAVAVLIGPAVALGTGLAWNSEARAQRQAIPLFDRFTSHMPAGLLIGEHTTHTQYEDLLTVCRQRAGRGAYRFFCAIENMSEQKSRQVLGAYEYNPNNELAPWYHCAGEARDFAVECQ